MADDWLNIALRLAVYLNLATIFGVALFGVYALHVDRRSLAIARRCANFVAAGALLGLALSVGAMAVLGKRLSGVDGYDDLTSQTVRTIVSETPVGLAWLVRMISLAACFSLAFSRRRIMDRLIGSAVLGAVALATVAWSGHGVMNEGVKGDLHLVADIAHLLAAGAWVGALVAFAALVTQPVSAVDSIDVMSRLANGFARMGSVIVATLVVTGALNYLLIVGASARPIFTTLYGGLLALKLALFMGMLGLAAANRFRLSPRLGLALTRGDHMQAAKMLRRSLMIEAGTAVLVLACVAWLGVLSPGR